MLRPDRRRDLLIIYGDGVTEAERAGGEMFGDERLLAAMMGAREASAAEALAAVLRAVDACAQPPGRIVPTSDGHPPV